MNMLGAVVLVCVLSCVRANLCPDITGCRCTMATRSSKPPYGIRARCSKNRQLRLQSLPLANVTYLQLKSCELSKQSGMEHLQNATQLVVLKLLYPPVEVFNWDWLPASCNSVTVTGRNGEFHLTSDQPASNGSCIINPFINVTKLYLYNLNYMDIPQCIPHTVKTLALKTAPLINLTGAATIGHVVRWPDSLELLQIKEAQMGEPGEHVFKHLPKTLRVFQVSSCVVPWQNISITMPSSIQSAVIINCGVKYTGPNTFQNLPRLKWLNLSGNKFTDVPQGLPRRVQRLYLHNNKLKRVGDTVWTGLENLTILDLTKNKLLSIPRNLPRSLETLQLRDNLISYCDRTTLEHLQNLKNLDLAYNRLLNMPQGLPPHSMESLKLNNNEIGLVRSPQDYTYCANCTYINLENNPWVCNQNMINMLLWLDQLKYINRLVISGFCASIQTDLGRIEVTKILRYMSYMTSTFPLCTYDVQTLNCSYAGLLGLPLPSPLGLLSVKVQHNPNLTSVPDDIFKQQNKLRVLSMDYNGLTHFPRGLPSSLEHIYLSNNQISAITSADQPTLDTLVNLKQLYLSGNQIGTMYDYQLQAMTSIKWLDLSNNPIVCDCSIQSLSMWYLSMEKRHRYIGLQRYLTPLCHEPPEQKDQMITVIIGAFYYLYNCIPTSCINHLGYLDCSRERQMLNNNTQLDVLPTIPPNTYWLTLDLSDLNLMSDDIKLTHLTRLTALNLTGNQLTTIPLNGLPSSIVELNLSGNKISELPQTTLIIHHLPNLKKLDLRNNSFQNIESKNVGLFLAVSSVLLQGNPLQCDCKLRPLITWIQTNEKNHRDLSTHDLKNLTCSGPPALVGESFISLSEAIYCPTTNVGLIVGVVCGVTALILIVVILVNIYLHKKRKKQERQDIVRGFKDLLEMEAMNELDPETGVGANMAEPTYDAFVSYSSDLNDCGFVYKMLEELEEKRGRKICFHERDFTPGRSIADNIVECISSSRRVMLVVSRKYASSAWCQYEVQVALTQLHEKRRGRLLVPILLEDLTKDKEYAGGVATILSAITGIYAPQPHDSKKTWNTFWDKLDKTLASKN